MNTERTLADLHARVYPLLARAPRGNAAVEFRAFVSIALNTTPVAVAAMRPQDTIAHTAFQQVVRAARKRRCGVPFAYLVGYKEFYGLRFVVTRATLIPRPQSELLVDLVCRYAHRHRWRWVHDCGTGSGCLAIAIRRNAPHLSVSANDITRAALRVARKNCRALLGSADVIRWLRGAGLRPIMRWQRKRGARASTPARGTAIDAIVANLPYLCRRELHEASIVKEPRRALHGRGARGTKIIERIIRQADGVLSAHGALFLECAPSQVAHLRAVLARARFSRVTVHCDLDGHKRALVAWRK